MWEFYKKQLDNQLFYIKTMRTFWDQQGSVNHWDQQGSVNHWDQQRSVAMETSKASFSARKCYHWDQQGSVTTETSKASFTARKCYHWEQQGSVTTENSKDVLPLRTAKKCYHWEQQGFATENSKEVLPQRTAEKCYHWEQQGVTTKNSKDVLPLRTARSTTTENSNFFFFFNVTLENSKVSPLRTAKKHYHWEQQRSVTTENSKEVLPLRKAKKCYHWEQQRSVTTENSKDVLPLRTAKKCYHWEQQGSVTIENSQEVLPLRTAKKCYHWEQQAALPLRTAKKYLTSFSTAPGSLHCKARFFTPSTASLRVPSSLDTMGAATRRAHFTHTLLLSTAWPPSEAADTVITDTLLSVDTVLGLKQCLLTVHVMVTFSWGYWHCHHWHLTVSRRSAGAKAVFVNSPCHGYFQLQ